MQLHKVFSTARKWGVALLGVAVQVAVSPWPPDSWRPWAAVVIAAATAAGVYKVPNSDGVGQASGGAGK